MERSSGLIYADEEEEEEEEEEVFDCCCWGSSCRTWRRVLPTSKGVVMTEAKAPERAPAVKLTRKVEVWLSFWVCVRGDNGEWRVISLLRIVS